MNSVKAILFVLCISLMDDVESSSCSLREYSTGFVCVCNQTYCDDLTVTEPQNFGDYIVVTSSKDGERFTVDKGYATVQPSVIRVERNADVNFNDKRTISMTINRDKKYQSIVGFGGAFTSTVSNLINLMPTELQHKFYKNYYSNSDGIGYSMMRIPIGGCDFDVEPWAYNESPADDTRLSNFTRLDERDLSRVAQIKVLKEITNNKDIKLVGSAWSPPRWMKTNNEWSGMATLKPEFYQTWADYHLQYLKLMAENDVQYWGITTGNEPLNGVIGWFFIHFMSLGLFLLTLNECEFRIIFFFFALSQVGIPKAKANGWRKILVQQ